MLSACGVREPYDSNLNSTRFGSSGSQYTALIESLLLANVLYIFGLQ